MFLEYARLLTSERETPNSDNLSCQKVQGILPFKKAQHI
jgi:hypothetical protein